MNGNGGIIPTVDLATTNGSGFGGGFFNGEGIWAIIILALLFGNNGWGGFGGGNAGAANGYVLATDFANLERKIDGVNSGLCDGFYAMAQQFSNTNQTIANSTAALQNTLCQGFNGLNVSYLQGTNAISREIADCCCTTQRSIDGVNFNLSQIGCGITNAINTATRDIVDNQNANYRALHDEIIANKLEMKNDRIAEQQNEINSLRLAASQERQNAYLLSELKPCPSAAYIVPNPNCCYNYGIVGPGYGASGCGCTGTTII